MIVTLTRYTDVLTLTDDQKAQLKALADKLILLAQ